MKWHWTAKVEAEFDVQSCAQFKHHDRYIEAIHNFYNIEVVVTPFYVSLEANLFMLLLGALQGGLLSFWFLKKSKRESANLYFGLFLAVVGLQLILKVLAKSWLTQNVFPWYVVSYQLPFLVGPLLFLYARSKDGNRYRSIDLVHFLPFITASAFDWTFLFWLRWIDLHPSIRAVAQIVLLGIYVYSALRLQLPSLKQFILTVAVVETVIIITMALMQEYYGNFPDVRWFFVVLTILIYWISWRVINSHPMFLPQVSRLPVQTPKSVKYAHYNLKEDEARRIEALLVAIMNDEKRYLEPTLSVEELARAMNVSKHHLSQVVNERLGKTFADYLTELRIAEVRRRLADPSHRRFTIATVAQDSGFNSISAFNEAFRKLCHTTPSSFRRKAFSKEN